MTIIKSKIPKVYKNKNLNSANFGSFNHCDYQIFLCLIAKIGGVDKKGKYLQPEQLQREHVLTAKEYADLFNADTSNGYKQINSACNKLMKIDIKIECPEGKRLTRINVCSKAEYYKSEGKIIIKFTDDIMPYLAQVKEKFLLYNIKEISNFGSIYTTRLYELLQEYKTTGWMEKSIANLRKVFSAEHKFKKYNDFKRKTFQHGAEEINHNHPSMNLRFEEKKETRKVTAIKFLFDTMPANIVKKQ